MERRNIIHIIFIILILLAIVFYPNVRKHKTLMNELEKIRTIDVWTGSIDMHIKTSGSYAVVEKEIKSYFNELLSHFHTLDTYSKETTLASILTASNYQKDGPVFQESKEYLNQLKTKVEEETTWIETWIQSRKLDIDGNLKEKYKTIYHDFMNNTALFNRITLELEQFQKDIYNDMTTCQDIFTFLSLQQDNWIIKDNKIVFTNQELLNQYNEYLKRIK